MVDFLHTIHKGLCEYAVAWSMKCVQYVEILDNLYFKNSLFTDSLARIDGYLSLFPVHHSLVIFKHMMKFNNGISTFMNSDKKKMNNLSASSFITGGFEAYKMPVLMFQLMFTLSRNDNFLPDVNSKNKMKEIGGNFIPNSELCNIFEVVMTALQSSVDFCIFMKAPFMKESDIRRLEKLICICRFRLVRLYRLNSILKQCIDSFKELRDETRIDDFSAKNPAVMKLHFMCHFIYQLAQFGVEKKSYDTEGSEGVNKEMKVAYHGSSRVPATQMQEMIKYISKKSLCFNFMDIMEHRGLSNSKSWRKVIEVEQSKTLQFKIVTNIARGIVFVDHDEHVFKCDDGDFKNNYIHVALSGKILYQVMESFGLFVDDDDIQFGDFRLIGKLRCLGSVVHDVAPFDILSIPHVERNRTRANSVSGVDSEHSFLEIICEIEEKSSNSSVKAKILCIGKVAAIIEKPVLVNAKWVSIVYLVMMWLVDVPPCEKKDTHLSYRQMRYEKDDHNNVVFNIVMLDSIHRPVCGIELLHDGSEYCFKDEENENSLKSLSYYIFTSAQVVFWGSSSYDNFLDPDVKADINANTDNIFQFDDDCLVEAEVATKEWEGTGEEDVDSDDEDEY